MKILKYIIGIFYVFSIFLNTLILWNFLPVKNYLTSADSKPKTNDFLANLPPISPIPMRPVLTIGDVAGIVTAIEITPTAIPTSTPYPTSTPQPTPTPTLIPTQVLPTPTEPIILPTFIPTNAPIPIFTPMPTYTPVPTSTLIPTPTITPIPALIPTSTPILPPADGSIPSPVSTGRTFQDLKTEIENITKKSSGKWGVIINDLINNDTIMINEANVVHGASVSKLVTAVTVMNKVERGQESFTKAVDGTNIQILLKRMINRSDNDAWASLNQLVGTDTIQQYAHLIGMDTYSVEGNQLSALDVYKLLKSLYFDEILNQEDKIALFNLMQNTQDETRIPPSIPINIPVVHKSGNYNDVYHDAGIVLYKRPYVIVVLGRGVDTLGGRSTIQSISKTVFDYYQNLYP